MVHILQQFDDWFAPTGCVTAVVENGVLLKALGALRYVCELNVSVVGALI